MKNGVRVVVDPSPGHFVSVGMFVNAGSRYETNLVKGCTHVLDKLGFHATRNVEGTSVESLMEKLGGNISCSTNRESIMYQAGVFNQDVGLAVKVLAATIVDPILTQETLTQVHDAVLYDVEQQHSKPETLLPELLHRVAFQEKTLGNPLWCEPDALEQMSLDKLLHYRNALFRPERVVVAGIGTTLKELEEYAEKELGDFNLPPVLPNISSATSNAFSMKSTGGNGITGEVKKWLLKPMATLTQSFSQQQQQAEDIAAAFPDNSFALYRGGSLTIAEPSQELSHLYLGFPGMGIKDDQVYALAVLQFLLGGGGSFSSGGPGKGMYSRIYTRLLNRYWWIEQCHALHNCYSDTGLFSISCAVHPQFASELPRVIAEELITLVEPGRINQTEFERAKNQLKSSLLMNLESRMVDLEDLGRQALIMNDEGRLGVQEMCDRIDQVTLPALQQVTLDMLRRSPITVVKYGQVEGLSNVERVFEKYGFQVCSHR